MQSHTGGVNVNEGRLLVNNPPGSSGTRTGNVIVNNSATLGGTGTIAGNLTFNDTSTLAPGASAGTLTVNGQLVLNSQAVLAYELNGSNKPSGVNINDLVVVGAGLTLDGTLNVTVPAGGNFATAPLGSQWRLFNYTGGLTNNSSTSARCPRWPIPSWGFVVDTSTTGQVNLLIAIVPEAPAWAFAGLASAMAAGYWRRRVAPVDAVGASSTASLGNQLPPPSDPRITLPVQVDEHRIHPGAIQR